MTVRALRDGDDAAVRSIFRSTLMLGRPVGFSLPDVDRYEALCLDWYLGAGRADAAVLEDGDAVVGYALVCTHPAAYRTWIRRAAVRFAAATAVGFARGRYPGPAGRFYALRVRDGWALRHAPVPPDIAQAHVNLRPSHRAGRAGRMLADHIDARVRATGGRAWFGEINAYTGQRAAAIERLGGRVVHRAPNHTMSALLGRPVERLTVVRDLHESWSDVA